jgi:TrmH family RNA methyltransferase
LWNADLTKPFGLVIGNEAHGISPEMAAAAEGLSIPTAGVESLNAAMATAILLYEASRQRALRP